MPAGSEAGLARHIRPTLRPKRPMPQPCRCATTSSSLTGFSLAGAPDSGTFNPLLLQVETPTIRFVITPPQFDEAADKCDTHSRESFHALTTLLGLTLYVDFPENPDACHKK